MGPAEGILELSCRDFHDQVLELNEPALIPDGLRGSPAIARWTPATLRSLNAGRLVDLDISQSGVWMFRGAADPKQQHTLKDVPFEKACDLITNAGFEDPKYYVPHLRIFEKLPSLQNDLGFPFSLNPSLSNFWFGSAGTVTRLHCDIDDNLFGQIYGSKKITLFSPQESAYLYQFPVTSATAHLSSVDIEEPDLTRYPLYRKARERTAILHAGQLLFIPAGWWHHVRSMEVSISVNQWLTTTTLQKRAVPSLLWFLIWEFKRDRWASLLERQQMPVRDLLDLADKLAPFNPSVATLAAAAALENSEIPEDGDAETASKVSTIATVLGELVTSIVQDSNAAISSALVAEAVKQIRLILDRVEQAALNLDDS